MAAIAPLLIRNFPVIELLLPEFDEVVVYFDVSLLIFNFFNFCGRLSRDFITCLNDGGMHYLNLNLRRFWIILITKLNRNRYQVN